ncbi:hypothetical protein DRQ33_00355 [bacterium]|nr:MAG: hypothetical protein DRQ33_00355 [bacterium]
MFRWLIVEDDFRFGETLAEALMKHGYEVAITRLGMDAVECIDYNFDGAIVDFNLFDISGDEVIATIKKDYPKLTLGLITGEQEIDLEKLATRCGANFYLRKPFTLSEILNIIEIYDELNIKQEVTNVA